ncbi:unnamed protein product [Rotaria sp. Silwood1]|nr:unnamed protein product [Rotaria sp. Silwood1]CAF3694595.1 unnamed protein product [Rotaria sp. Silwood1]CAF3694873.1 unnamed protein product [Rotaria sp. Silwood1]CAF4746997.1 unnamed protein product [Rotaria sp. Silwood1]CAF4846329.1 unnamed protein product [Rotaria sp. Silwood1]
MTEKKLIRRPRNAIQRDISSYNEVHQDIDTRKAQYSTLVTNYYSLTTDIYESGWGRSFHCANRFHGETFAESIQRHESYLALRMQLKPGDKVLDIGCGVGGPLRRIAYLTGAHITGITISPYQVQRAREIGVPTNCEFIQGDFMKLPFEDNSFDHVYAIESVCHAPEKSKCFAEVFRVLKPGGSFVGYDACLTDKYDNQNPEHVETIRTMEASLALPQLKLTREFVADLESVGFNVEENRIIPEADIPSYQPLDGGDSFFSFNHHRTGPLARRLAHCMIWLTEKIRIAPKGSTAMSNIWQKSVTSFLRARKLDIFTSLFFVLARKP